MINFDGNIGINMSSEASIYQILFQNEMLFESTESVVQPVSVIPEKTAVAAKPEVKATPSEVLTTKINEGTPVKPALLPLGPIQHSIIVAVDESGQKEIPASEALLLDNILKAVKYSTAQADIFNLSFLEPIDARNIFSENKTRFVISFGVQLMRWQIDLMLLHYSPKQSDGIWFLLADPLSDIEKNVDLKKKLWQSLQTMFSNA